MRRLVFSSLVALALCTSLVGCKPSDPNAFETYTAQLDDPNTRAAAMGQLERLAKGAASGDSEERKQEFADKVIPAFVKLWDDADPETRQQMLTMVRDVGRPEAVELWKKAIVLDGTAEGAKASLLALQGIRDAKATDATDAVIEQFDKLIQDPSMDEGEETGRIRLEYAKTLGILGDTKAVPVLIKALGQPVDMQPVAIHRETIKALGDIGDASAAEALLVASISVPDGFSTTNVFNRVMIALAHFGADAYEPAFKMFKGENEQINKLAAEADPPLDDRNLKTIAVQFLGVIGSPKAVPELVAFMPQDDCVEGGEWEDEEAETAGVVLRSALSRQLGFIGDEGAVETLCKCSVASRRPADMFEIAQALGYIGGKNAAECLANTVVTNGDYRDDVVENSDFRYQIRWEAGRFAVLAAGPDEVATVQAAFDAQKDEKVKAGLEPWKKGIDLTNKCKADAACYMGVLENQDADWFEREKAAVEVAKLKKGDKDAALAISKAFKVRNPDARVTMAVLAPRVLDGTRCQECADAFQGVMDAEKGSMDAKMQLAVLKARHAIAKLEDPGAAKAAGGGDEAAPEE